MSMFLFDFIVQKLTVVNRGATSTPQRVSDSSRRAVLLGMGGKGKTQAALKYCRQAFLSATFDTVLWIDATTQASAQQAIESIVSRGGH